MNKVFFLQHAKPCKTFIFTFKRKQGRKRQSDTPKRMIERREREEERLKEIYREGGRDKRDKERERER